MTMLVRLLAWSIALALVALPLIAVLNGWLAADRWPIEKLRLTAEYQRVSAEQVRAAAAPHLLHQGFFAVDLEAVREAVAAVPWVAKVEVRKQWPDVVVIDVREHQAIARWTGDRLVSADGGLFAAPGGVSLQGLPELEGPDERIADVLAMNEKITPLLQAQGLALHGLKLSARGSWSLTLGGGAKVMIGRGDPLPRMQRFARLLPPLLAGEGRPLVRADLRYANGFALTWQDPQPEGGAEPAADTNTARNGA